MINREIPELTERKGFHLGPRPIVIIVVTGQQFLVFDTMLGVIEAIETARLANDKNKWVEMKNPAGERVYLAPWIIDKIVGMYEVGGNPCKMCNGTGRG